MSVANEVRLETSQGWPAHAPSTRFVPVAGGVAVGLGVGTGFGVGVGVGVGFGVGVAVRVGVGVGVWRRFTAAARFAEITEKLALPRCLTSEIVVRWTPPLGASAVPADICRGAVADEAAMRPTPIENEMTNGNPPDRSRTGRRGALRGAES
jgi:hypothetical protein